MAVQPPYPTNIPQRPNNAQEQQAPTQQNGDPLAEAKARVASMGGNPRDVSIMMQLMRQGAAQQMAAGPQNNVENYIDQVLQMGGMTPGPHSPDAMRQQSLADSAANTPSTTMPDDGSVNPGTDTMPSDDISPDSIPDPEDSQSFPDYAKLLMGLLGGVGGLAVAKALWDRFKGKNESTFGVSSGPDDGTRNPSMQQSTQDAMRTRVGADDVMSLEDLRDQPDALSQDKRKLLQGPPDMQQEQSAQQAISGPRNEDPTSLEDLIEGNRGQTYPEAPDQDIQDKVEGRNSAERPGSSRYANEGSLTDRARIIQEASKLKTPQEVMSYLKANNIEVDDEIMRILAETSNAARGNVKRATRSAAQ